MNKRKRKNITVSLILKKITHKSELIAKILFLVVL